MSARAFNWACQQKPKTTSQKLVLLVLADRADEDGFAYPGNTWISNKASPMPKETVRRVIRELSEQGLIVKEQRRRRQDGTLGVWELRLPIDQRSPVNGGGHGCTVEPPVTSARADSRTTVTERENPNGFSTVVDHWISLAPTLTAHKRAPLLADKPTRKLVDAAVKANGVDDVVAAVSNYAAVLDSPGHWLSQRWTLHLFFKQRNAFPMFLPEADPMTNYLNRDTRSGRDRGVSFNDILNGGTDESGTLGAPRLGRAA